ncbi:hypothetical protein DWB77_06392 [Streptomyces hundungensis]|uniref:Uncharacterized protein n=1 Tax=Streptomyces hundungensis TaxID=1077946 RepID=A0A387HKU2_9ACTN|nr:hypothetical protein DWB77_06392 [Streptomyces hundungensis]
MRAHLVREGECSRTGMFSESAADEVEGCTVLPPELPERPLPQTSTPGSPRS